MVGQPFVPDVIGHANEIYIYHLTALDDDNDDDDDEGGIIYSKKG